MLKDMIASQEKLKNMDKIYIESLPAIKEGYRITGDPRANYIDGIWNQEDSDKWLTVIQVPVEKV